MAYFYRLISVFLFLWSGLASAVVPVALVPAVHYYGAQWNSASTLHYSTDALAECGVLYSQRSAAGVSGLSGTMSVSGISCNMGSYLAWGGLGQWWSCSSGVGPDANNMCRSCPPNSTGISSCICDTGYSEDPTHTFCVAPCPSGISVSATVGVGWFPFSDGLLVSSIPPLKAAPTSICTQNGSVLCAATGGAVRLLLLSSEAVNGSVPVRATFNGVLTGATCPGPVTPSIVTASPPPCAGQSGMVNGVTVCIAPLSDAAKEQFARDAASQAASLAMALASAAATAAGASPAAAASAGSAAAAAAGAAAYSSMKAGSSASSSAQSGAAAGAAAGLAAANASTSAAAAGSNAAAAAAAAAAAGAPVGASAGAGDAASSAASSAAIASGADAATSAAVAAAAGAAAKTASDAAIAAGSTATAAAAAAKAAGDAAAAASLKAASDAAAASALAGQNAAAQAAAALAAGNAAAAAQAAQIKAAGDSAAAAIKAAQAAKDAAATDPISEYCIKNPTATICKSTVDSTFSGVCGSPPACTGDAVMCAVAAATFATNCALSMPDSTFESFAYDLAKTRTGDLTKDLPGNSTVDVGPSAFSQVDLLGGGGGGMHDVTISVHGQSLNLPFSSINPWLSKLGVLLQAVTFLVCAYIVTGSRQGASA
jgi:hypothetical protein